MAVPEADRDAHKTPLYHEKKLAIPGIPLVDEDGADVMDSENDSKNGADRFKQSIYDNNMLENFDEDEPEINSASKILSNCDAVDIKLSKKSIRRAS